MHYIYFEAYCKDIKQLNSSKPSGFQEKRKKMNSRHSRNCTKSSEKTHKAIKSWKKRNSNVVLVCFSLKYSGTPRVYIWSHKIYLVLKKKRKKDQFSFLDLPPSGWVTPFSLCHCFETVIYQLCIFKLRFYISKAIFIIQSRR